MIGRHGLTETKIQHRQRTSTQVVRVADVFFGFGDSSPTS